jgi:DNA-binding transcriptional ArsR family regulator
MNDNVSEYKNGDELMKKDIVKSIMHPVRIKIIQELGMNEKATTKEIQEACKECSQATLYRHLKALLEIGIIEVVSENTINGIIEKVYGLRKEAPEELFGDPSKITKDGYNTMFSQFIVSLLADFSDYMKHDDALDNIQNHIGFNTSILYLTDEELVELSQKTSSLLFEALKKRPEPGRKMRKLSHIVTTTITHKK